VIRLIIAGLVLAGVLAVAIAAHATYAGASAVAVTSVAPSTVAGEVLVGLVQVLFAAAAVVALALTLRYRRFRLLVSLAAGAVLASAVLIGIVHTAGGTYPRPLPASGGQWSWLIGASLAGPVLLAAAVAGAVTAAPWLNRPWRRTAWTALWLAAAARLITSTASPVEILIAFAVGITVGAGVLVLLGAPDRRIGPDAIATALVSAGLPVASVEPATVEAKGSRPFIAVCEDGKPLFVKILGSDQRDADLLYRVYRFARLRDIGDTRPAASLIQAVEHQALVAVMAERAGVTVPAVRSVIKTADGSALLAMDLVNGSSLDVITVQCVDDPMIRELWKQVDRLHRAGIAHRSLRAANIVVDVAGRPWITDFSFGELGATQRQIAIDVAELLASLATIVGAERAVAAAAAVIGPDAIAAAVPLLQPLALSAGTRRAIARHDGLLTQTREAAATSGRADQELARIQRVHPRTLLAIAAAAGGFYFLLPRLARVGSSWHAVQSADWVWLPLVLALSAATYLASAVALIGAVSQRIPFWPTLLTQGASSFVNRVSPANVGGMALNVRFLQKSGVDTGSGVAAVGLNSAVGAVVHLILIVVFFTCSGRRLAKAFKLPSSSKLLLIAAVVAAVVGIVLATHPGRRLASKKLIPGVRTALGSLKRLPRDPARMLMLFGGSLLITLGNLGALIASVQAFGGGPGVVEVGAVYLGATAVAAAAPTPGGLGAVEAALVAGLTGVGVPGGPAVSAVLLQRLATYWLPVVPGWLSWLTLQRREYV
jgi:undecaprenyl-diphosphatase